MIENWFICVWYFFFLFPTAAVQGRAREYNNIIHDDRESGIELG